MRQQSPLLRPLSFTLYFFVAPASLHYFQADMSYVPRHSIVLQGEQHNYKVHLHKN